MKCCFLMYNCASDTFSPQATDNLSDPYVQVQYLNKNCILSRITDSTKRKTDYKA